jgi:hypothetical protein
MFTVCEVLQRARLDQGIDLATVFTSALPDNN